MRAIILAFALSALSLGACGAAPKPAPGPPGEPPASAGTAISAYCGGGFTGGGAGVTITADDHIIRWAQLTAGAQKTETDLGPNPAFATDVRRRLNRLGFADIHFNQPGNMTCSLSAGGHTVAWSQGDPRAPSSVVDVHALVLAAHGGE